MQNSRLRAWSCLLFDRYPRLQKPGAVALWTFRGLVQFPLREHKTAGAAAGWFDHGLVLCMLETPEKMV
jgi:hypothetical protein